MQERVVEVDGKKIKESEMPKDCFLIQGKWYTEKGLPKELAAYKRLWGAAKSAKQLGKTADEEETTGKKSSIPTSAPTSEPTNTAPHAADAASPNNADT